MKLKIHARDGTILGFKEKDGKPHKPHDQGETSLMRILVVEGRADPGGTTRRRHHDGPV
ncbi:MAG: hypothetical protein R3E35_09245 [Rhodocyclaceae bacterium]